MSVRRNTALALMVALVVAACGNPSATRAPQATGTPSTSGAPMTSGPASAEPSQAASEEPSAAASEEPSAAASEQPTHGASDAPSTEPSTGAGGGDVDSAAADLRTTLDIRLGEHLMLVAKATGAALGGRTEEFDAYGTLLNTNGTELGAMIGSVYGADAEDEFNRIWSAHNGFFVDYTTGVASDDQALADGAVEDLTTIYVPEFTTLIVSATGLPQDAVESLITDHVLQTKAVLDAQASKDWAAAYAATRAAYAHMQMMGDALAGAIVEGDPAAFAGDPDAPAVGLRVALNQLLQEHLYLVSFATGSALGERSGEFMAAGKALNTNGTDLGAAIGQLFGADAEDEFNRIWSAHNGFFVDYTTGVAMGDMAMQDQAVTDLTETYVPEFAAFLAGATGFPKRRYRSSSPSTS